MIDALKEGLNNKTNGGLLIILFVMLLAIYASHNFSKEQRALDKSDLAQDIDNNNKHIEKNADAITDVRVELAKRYK